jgi:heme/copper-type cytochrome/quinol oxidase subunit 2
MSTKKNTSLPPLFNNNNYVWMAIGAAIIAIGMFLMSGGKNENPNVFDENVVYSTVRITVAPFLIVAGLLVQVFAIFKKSK